MSSFIILIINLLPYTNPLINLKSKKGRYQKCQSLNFIRKDKMLLGINVFKIIKIVFIYIY